MQRPRIGFSVLMLGITVLALVACAAPAAPANTGAAPAATDAPTEAPAAAAGTEMTGTTTGAMAGSMDDLVTAAKAEGQLTTIALPHDWCNYGERDRWLQTEIWPRGQRTGPQRRFRRRIWKPSAPTRTTKVRRRRMWSTWALPLARRRRNEGLIQPYKVSTWDSIPDKCKDADGYWYGDYYGVLSFEVNADVVQNAPQDWADLLKPEYKGQVALAGDPRTSNQAIQSVFAASLANGGALDDAGRAWSSLPS